MASFNSNVTKVDSSDENVMLLDESYNRHMVTIYNNSAFSLYIKYGANAASDSFTLRINSGDYLEFPSPCYTGRIDAFWEGIDGNAMITEITN
jgi:hypothetical protein